MRMTSATKQTVQNRFQIQTLSFVPLNDSNKHINKTIKKITQINAVAERNNNCNQTECLTAQDPLCFFKTKKYIRHALALALSALVRA